MKQRKDLINQIQDNDHQIQSYVEDDYPKTPEELKNMTITELRDWSDTGSSNRLADQVGEFLVCAELGRRV